MFEIYEKIITDAGTYNKVVSGLFDAFFVSPGKRPYHNRIEVYYVHGSVKMSGNMQRFRCVTSAVAFVGWKEL